MVEKAPEQRKGGRPRREDGPKMPYHEVDRLLVEGELVVGDDGVERRVWLSQREVARRFDVSPSLIAAFAKQHRCTERRKAFEARKAAGPTAAETSDGPP
jgi:transposase-like protein